MTSAVAKLIEALRQVLGNPSIRRAEASWLIAESARWAFVVSGLVFAYEIGGVVGVGLASTLRMLPAAVLAPVITTLADRLPPARLLLGVHLGRGVAIGLAAVIVATGLPDWLFFALIVGEGVLAALERPTTLVLMPTLARSPQELIATNAVTSTGEAAGVLIGPVVAGLLIAAGGTAIAVAIPAAAFGVAALIVLGIHGDPTAARVAIDAAPSRLAQVLAGFDALRRYPSAGLLIGLFSAQTFVRGILTVLLVAVSVELLGLGEAGVGYLNAAIGAGGLLGAFVTVALVLRRHLGGPFSAALAIWGIPIALMGLLPDPTLAFVFLAVLGVANASLDVAGMTLLQRGVPNRVRGRVFGALEGIVSLTFGLGSLAAPLLVSLLGLQPALVVTGMILPVAALVTARAVNRTDAAAIVPHRQLELLRAVPMFAPLPMTALEQIAGGLVEERHAVDAEVIRQGASGDCWYLIAAGTVDVVHDGALVRRLGPGDGFGEIALLSQRPRTATIVVREAVELFRLPRTVFLGAVTGNPHAVLAADQLVSERLAELGHVAHSGS